MQKMGQEAIGHAVIAVTQTNAMRFGVQTAVNKKNKRLSLEDRKKIETKISGRKIAPI